MTSIGFKKDGEWIFACSEDGTMRLHDLRLSGAQVLFKNEVELNTVVLMPSEGDLIAGDQEGKVLIYDLVGGKVRKEFVK